MSLELLNTIATLATLAVITATAVAALVQLRHLSAANQLVGYNELRQAFNSPDLMAAYSYVAMELDRDLEDQTFRRQIGDRSLRTPEAQEKVRKLLLFGNFFENYGLLVKRGLLPKELVLDAWTENVLWSWNKLGPVIAIFRREQEPWGWSNFEYLAVLAEEWIAAHPNGTYPADTRRMPISDPYRDED